ncbi:MAG: Cys-tRNA(Pro) deacylase [Anaerolineaceae bacterium]|nr:Cys-tRNA(Pro) deacylase [Anaerolineaceae bacterium]
MPITNNVTRLLDSRKIKYTAFALPAEKLGAQKTAELLNVSPEVVYKTIVALRDKPGKTILAVIPGNCELNLKALAAALGEKRIRLATLREAEQLTGLLAGGISPLALINKGFQVVVDQTAQIFDQIHISGGQRGLNLRMDTKDLVALTHSHFAPISAESEHADEME